MVSSSLPTATIGEVEQPRYLQLAGLMRGEIDGGVLQVNDRLPGEREICKRFGVSRTTVRHALEELERMGYVRPDPTRGWFVTPFVEPNALLGFTDLADERGLDAASRVLTCLAREATLEEGDALGAPPGAEVLELERVRLLGGVPVGIQRAVAAAWLAPSLVAQDYACRLLVSRVPLRRGTPRARRLRRPRRHDRRQTGEAPRCADGSERAADQGDHLG